MKKLQLLLVGIVLCFFMCGAVQGTSYLSEYDAQKVLLMHMNESSFQATNYTSAIPVTSTVVSVNTTNKQFGAGAATFDGTLSNLSLYDNPDWTLGSNWTMEAWIYSRANLVGTTHVIFSHDPDANQQVAWVVNTTGQLRFVVYDTGYTSTISGSTQLQPNTWYHVAVIQSNATTTKMYVNGVEESYSDTLSAAVPDFEGVVYVGRGHPNAYYWKGEIDELAIWKGVAIPISELYPQPVEIDTPLQEITANFTASNTSGIQPLYVQFTDTSTTTDATIDSLAWDFGDGNTSTSQSPSHLYEVPGTYQANLTITNTSYSLVSTKLVTITVYKQPVCDFSSFNTVGTAPFTTRLFDTSTNLNTGPYTYYTDFGDGNTSTEEALYYNWNITGTYDVKHCITDSVTTACNNKTAYVTVGTATIAPVA